MPYTFGDSLFDIHDLDVLVAADMPLLERPSRRRTRPRQSLPSNIAALIQDGDTLQSAWAASPASAASAGGDAPSLDKKDLGIHTEMITDSIISLVEAGVLTGRKKTLDRGKIVASFCMAPAACMISWTAIRSLPFKPSEYVNDPVIISRQEHMWPSTWPWRST